MAWFGGVGMDWIKNISSGVDQLFFRNLLGLAFGLGFPL
jgi:hypothetical protein